MILSSVVWPDHVAATKSVHKLSIRKVQKTSYPDGVTRVYTHILQDASKDKEDLNHKKI